MGMGLEETEMVNVGPRLTEKRILAVDPQLITANGNAKGRIVVPTSYLFLVGQLVTLVDDIGNNVEYQIKRIVDKFIFLGNKGKGINDRCDLRQWQIVNNPKISAIEQERPNIPSDQIQNFQYAEEPIMAQRMISVDHLGRYNTLREYESESQPSEEKSLNVSQRGPLGFMAFRTFIEKFMGEIEYDQVENNVEGNVEFLTFRSNNEIVKQLAIRYDGCSWFISNTFPPGNYEGSIVEEDADFIVTESGEKLGIIA